MTKKEYLDELSRQLRPLNENEREDIILEFASHIDDAMERKPELDEASLMASLPHPSVLAKQFLDEAGYSPESGRGSASGRHEQSERRDDRSDRFRSYFRYATSEHAEIEETYDNIQKVEIRGISSDIRAVPGQHCKIRVEGYWEEDSMPEIDASGSTLRLDLGKETENLTIELPPYLVEFLARSISGDMELSLPSGVSARVETTSGDLAIRAENSHIQTLSVSGDQHLTGTSLDLKLKTTSGDVHLNDFGGSAAVTTASGDVRIACGEKPESIEATTMSGDVSIRLPVNTNPFVRASSVSGDVEVRNARTISRPGKSYVENPGSDGEITAHTMSGDIIIN